MKEPFVEPVGLKSHMLIRVGLNVREGEWFGIRPDMSAGLITVLTAGSDAEQEVRGLWRRILRFPGRNGSRHKEAGEREKVQEKQTEKIRRVEDDMKALAAEILELAGEENRCYVVYDDSVRRAVLKKRADAFRDLSDRKKEPEELDLPSLWHQYMNFEEFSGYTQDFWTGLLMPQAIFCHFVILGTAPCVPEWIKRCAFRMRSLKWILSEDKCGPEILDFVEDFYTEYGLAISLQTLPAGGNLKALGTLCSLPSNILDFTGDSCVNIPEIASGSVWLDFWSVEEKRRRIVGHCPGVSYFSLKEKWRHAQRRCREPLLP